MPWSSTTSVSVPGTVADQNSFDGQSIARVLAVDEADLGPVGREVVELLGVDVGERLGLPALAEASAPRVVAASPASFQPSKAATTTGERSAGCAYQRTCVGQGAGSPRSAPALAVGLEAEGAAS